MLEKSTLKYSNYAQQLRAAFSNNSATDFARPLCFQKIGQCQ